MHRLVWLSAVLAAAGLLHAQKFPPDARAAFPPDIGPATITVSGVSGQTVAMNLADLLNLPRHTVKTTDHGTPVTFEGVLLKDVLARVDLPAGDQFRKTAAAYYLVVQGGDGYRAVFAWSEIDATIMDKPLYLVAYRDGKPLSSADGPFELIAPGEKRNVRWVKQVTALAIRQAH